MANVLLTMLHKLGVERGDVRRQHGGDRHLRRLVFTAETQRTRRLRRENQGGRSQRFCGEIKGLSEQSMLKILIGGICLAGLLGAASDSRLSEAAMQGNKEVVRSLLKDRVDVDGAQGDGSTALHWAALHDDLDMVKMLVAAGANVKAATREGAITPLFMACQNGNAAIIEALLKAGADANAVNANGTTVLMTAAASGSADAVKVLICLTAPM